MPHDVWHMHVLVSAAWCQSLNPAMAPGLCPLLWMAQVRYRVWVSGGPHTRARARVCRGGVMWSPMGDEGSTGWACR